MTKETSEHLPIQQLLIISLAKFSMMFSISQVSPYFPAYIAEMDISPNNISTWIGISTLVYALPECFFAIIWSALSSRVGRKPVICFGLLLLMGANLGVGFCTSIWQILVFTAVSGAANGTASVIQTINAELVPSEKSQAKALAFVPAAAAIGAIFGPVIGGLLVKKDFDRNSVLKKHPFALPNIIAGCFTLVAILTATLFLKETLNGQSKLLVRVEGKSHWPHSLFSKVRVQNLVTGGQGEAHDHPDGSSSTSLKSAFSLITTEVENDKRPQDLQNNKHKLMHYILPTCNRYIWVSSLLGFHSIGFDQLIPITLHFSSLRPGESPWNTVGGFNMNPRDIGIFLTSCGVVGLMTTILIYPRIARRFNAMKTLRLAVALFPLIYFAFPFSTFPRLCALQLSFLILLTVFKVIITVFSFQSCLILLTNSVPGRERASINGLNVAVSSISRGLGGLLSGLAFSLGARSGHVVIAYWILAPVSIAGLGLTLCVAKDEQFREE